MRGPDDGLPAFVGSHFLPGHVYTFVGAGGKSTGMRKVAGYLRRAGLRVRMSTTTRVGIDEFSAYPAAVVRTDGGLASCLASREPVLLIAGGIDEQQERHTGIAASLIEGASIPGDLVLLVEGDGSRRLPIKAPTDREPVITANSAAVFALMGARAFEETIDAACCYNPEGVLALLGAAGGVFDVPTLLRLAVDARGCRKGVLPGMDYHLVVNQGDLVEKRNTAIRFIRQLRDIHGIMGTVLSWQEEKIYESTTGRPPPYPGDSAQPHAVQPRALIRGAGDLATGVALSLHHAGFQIVMTEIPEPTVIRRTVAFAQAVFQGSQTVEGVTARLSTAEGAEAVLREGRIAVVVDPQSEIRHAFAPDLLVDAILEKRNLGTTMEFAPIVIGLGPGFTAGVDVHAVIETMRGHELGKLIREGSALANTGMPGSIEGKTGERVLRAPVTGRVTLGKRIGDLVRQGETVMSVGGVPITAPFDGCLRGLIHEGIIAARGLKIGDIDPRGESRYCSLVSDKARALGRAVLEAAVILGKDRGVLRLAWKRGPGA